MSGQNAKGRIQNRRTLLPVVLLGVGRLLQDASESEERRIANVKSFILKKLAIKTEDGQTILMQISSETVVTDAVMRLSLGANPVSCAAFLPHPENIVEAAFEEHGDMLCVPRQLASVLAITLDEAISFFDEFMAIGWQATGVTPLQ